MKLMKSNGVLAACVVLVVCLSAVCLSTSQPDRRNYYEIRPEITIPESKTDTARMIDAYERLMDNYRQLMESNLAGLHAEVGTIGQKLDSIDRKMSMLSAQMETIQKKLGIEPAPKQSKKQVDAQDPNRTAAAVSEKSK